MLSRQLTVGLGLGALAGLALLAQRRSSYTYRGKVVIITGGSRGLGLVLARQLARQGARLALLARDPQELAEASRQVVETCGGEALTLPCDVTDPNQIAEAVDIIMERFGRIDVLINNAGIIQVAPLDHMRLSDFEQAMALHLYASLYLTLAVLPHMRQRGEGRIANITSIGGKVAVPHLLPYSVSKFALVGLSDGLRHELRKSGIHVTTVVPGLMRTGSPFNVTVRGRHEKEWAWFVLGDSLPLVSMNVERAARKIVHAIRRGDASLTLTLSAKAAVLLNALTPGLMARVLASVDRYVLPAAAPGAGGDETRLGWQSESRLTRSPLTALTRRAAARNNE